MADKITAVKVEIKDGVAGTKIVFSHPMTTYNQAEQKTGNKDDANFITHITAKVGEETVLDVSTSQFFSKNPIIKFNFKCDSFKLGKKLSGREIDSGVTRTPAEIGDKLVVTATDRKGNTLTEEVELTTSKTN